MTMVNFIPVQQLFKYHFKSILTKEEMSICLKAIDKGKPISSKMFLGKIPNNLILPLSVERINLSSGERGSYLLYDNGAIFHIENNKSAFEKIACSCTSKKGIVYNYIPLVSVCGKEILTHLIEARKINSLLFPVRWEGSSDLMLLEEVARKNKVPTIFLKSLDLYHARKIG